jgi:hypothetical protein
MGCFKERKIKEYVSSPAKSNLKANNVQKVKKAFL